MKKSEKIQLVKKAKKQIDALTKERDQTFNRLLQSLGIDPITGDDDALFNFLYNNRGTATSAIENTEFLE